MIRPQSPPPFSHLGGILFAEDFDLPDGIAHVLVPEDTEPEVITPSYSAAEIEAARSEGFVAGEAAGREAARADREEAAAARQIEIAQTLAAIAAALDTAREAGAEVAKTQAEGIARLLLKILAAMIPAVCARHGEVEAAAVARAVLPGLRGEPRISVRVNAAIADGLRARLADIDPDIVERVTVVPTAMVAGDVRITWREGEAVRDTAALWREIAEVLTSVGILGAPLETTEKNPEHDDAE